MTIDSISFGSIANFRNGLNYSRENMGVGLKVISVGSFGDRMSPDYDAIGEIDPSGVAGDDDLLNDGDILFVRSNGNRDLVARVMFITRPPYPVAYSGFCIRARMNRDAVNPKFYYYVFRSQEARIRLVTGGVGANIVNVSQKTLSRFEVPYPPRGIQDKCVSVLSAYDDLIAANQRRIQLLEESARLLYREWFVRLRFPGHEAVSVTDGVPEGWGYERLEAAFVMQRGFDLPASERKNGDIPVYASTGIGGFHNQAKVPGPGVVTGRSGTLGEVHFVHEDFWPLNTTLWVKEFRRVTPLLAFFMLTSLDLSIYNAGASVPTLDRKTVHAIDVLIPHESVQVLFERTALPIFGQIEAITQHNDKLKEARDLLLPKLMSGALDVSRIAVPKEVAA